MTSFQCGIKRLIRNYSTYITKVFCFSKNQIIWPRKSTGHLWYIHGDEWIIMFSFSQHLHDWCSNDCEIPQFILQNKSEGDPISFVSFTSVWVGITLLQHSCSYFFVCPFLYSWAKHIAEKNGYLGHVIRKALNAYLELSWYVCSVLFKFMFHFFITWYHDKTINIGPSPQKKY